MCPLGSYHIGARTYSRRRGSRAGLTAPSPYAKGSRRNDLPLRPAGALWVATINPPRDVCSALYNRSHGLHSYIRMAHHAKSIAECLVTTEEATITKEPLRTAEAGQRHPMTNSRMSMRCSPPLCKTWTRQPDFFSVFLGIALYFCGSASEI
jgi:hypothetical protein